MKRILLAFLAVIFTVYGDPSPADCMNSYNARKAQELYKLAKGSRGAAWDRIHQIQDAPAKEIGTKPWCSRAKGAGILFERAAGRFTESAEYFRKLIFTCASENWRDASDWAGKMRNNARDNSTDMHTHVLDYSYWLDDYCD